MPRALWTSLMRLFRDRLFVVGRVVHGGPRLDVVGAGDVSEHGGVKFNTDSSLNQWIQWVLAEHDRIIDDFNTDWSARMTRAARASGTIWRASGARPAGVRRARGARLAPSCARPARVRHADSV